MTPIVSSCRRHLKWVLEVWLLLIYQTLKSSMKRGNSSQNVLLRLLEIMDGKQSLLLILGVDREKRFEGAYSRSKLYFFTLVQICRVLLCVSQVSSEV